MNDYPTVKNLSVAICKNKKCNYVYTFSQLSEIKFQFMQSKFTCLGCGKSTYKYFRINGEISLENSLNYMINKCGSQTPRIISIEECHAIDL